jgi:A/G-specific adenine glycosylase
MRSMLIKQFQTIVYEYYGMSGRHDLPWRKSEPDGSFDPYKILVSELMLQQTQVTRVTTKYSEFLSQFPNATTLAAAPLGDVLRAWSGLGYNRRAQFLHRAAQQIVTTGQGRFPRSQLELTQLPGIGTNTAGAIMAYAYNQPVVFVETNIRTVFIHHFFHNQIQIGDTAVLERVMEALDREDPRHWYWALMDYGSHLKRSVGNVNRLSASYAKQSTFHGSRRQIRGQILRALQGNPQRLDQLQARITDERLDAILVQLVAEGLIQTDGMRFSL